MVFSATACVCLTGLATDFVTGFGDVDFVDCFLLRVLVFAVDFAVVDFFVLAMPTIIP